MPAIHAVSCDCQIFQVNFFLLSYPTEKLPFGSLLFPFAFFQDDRRIAMLLAPGHNRAAFLVLVAWTVRNIYVMGNRKNTTAKERSYALIVVVKRCDKFLHVITGKSSVLYFKSGGKVKSKWPIGGRLWISLESIWLKIKVILGLHRHVFEK